MSIDMWLFDSLPNLVAKEEVIEGIGVTVDDGYCDTLSIPTSSVRINKCLPYGNSEESMLYPRV